MGVFNVRASNSIPRIFVSALLFQAQSALKLIHVIVLSFELGPIFLIVYFIIFIFMSILFSTLYAQVINISSTLHALISYAVIIVIQSICDSLAWISARKPNKSNIRNQTKQMETNEFIQKSTSLWQTIEHYGIYRAWSKTDCLE